MKKNLVVTYKINTEISDLTIPSIQNYSKKIKCEFITLTPNEEVNHTLFDIGNLLTEYNRVIFISPYLLVREDTPNLFEIVPEHSLGMFNEGRYAQRDIHIKSAISFYNEKLNTDWNGKYYNDDVIVISKKHRMLFSKPNIDLGTEVTPYLNLKIHNNDIKVFKLDYKFNRMEFLDAHVGISRLDSYIVNYTDAPNDIIRDIVVKDINKWKEDSPKFEYKQNILIRLSAGLGDQIESEPVARYIRKIYPNANIYLTTHHPRIFEHLNKYGIEVFDYSKWKGINDALIVMENNPDQVNSINRLTQVLFHPTDFSSISMIRRIIPTNEKSITIAVKPEEIESVTNLVKSKNKDKKSIIVHAGKWWPSKTFPKDWWQTVVNLLSEKLTVILIGKTLSEKQGYLDIECPKDGFDFRDFTTLGENISLISLCKVTLSNDSSPIHIAGAFDNWIVTVPTCKHPDHILPWRNGSQSHKTKALYSKLLQDDLEVRHTQFYFDTIDMLPKNKKIDEYLPTPEEVVREIFEIYKEDDIYNKN